jgi:hypothetical protein
MSTVTFEVINVSTDSDALVMLAAREYTSDYTALPNANLPKDLRRDLGRVFELLTGEEFPLEENTFLIKSVEGSYNRLFGPVLNVGNSEVEGTQDGQLYVRWGPRFIPLGLQKGSMTNYAGAELEVEFGTYNFSGRGEDAALFISYEADNGTTYQLPVAVRFTDWENPIEAKALNAMLKKSPDQILTVVQPASAKSGGGGNLDEVDLRFLEVGQPYEIVGYRGCKTKFGNSYRVVVKDYPEEGQNSEGWARPGMKKILATSPDISEDNPAEYIIRHREQTDDNKYRIQDAFLLSVQTISEAGEGELNLNF